MMSVYMQAAMALHLAPHISRSGRNKLQSVSLLFKTAPIRKILVLFQRRCSGAKNEKYTDWIATGVTWRLLGRGLF